VDSTKIYYSGDSGYSSHFKKIGDKYGPFDLVFIETGQYAEAWKELHLMPYEWNQVYNDLKAKRYFPVHWGMFPLNFDPWYQPIQDVIEVSEKNNMNLITSKIGEIVQLGKEKNNTDLWKRFIMNYKEKYLQ
jgi:L-ascorbate metabolism protein UlaG (beta-lactamase superfamily)